MFGAAVEAPVAAGSACSSATGSASARRWCGLPRSSGDQPDAALGGLAFGPHVVIARDALAQTQLLGPGALVNYDYRLRLPPGSDLAAWTRKANAAFPEAGWQLRTSADASPPLRRFIDRIGFFLNLVGITALLIGGVGVGNAVAGYVASRTAAIATLKCLGASTRLVFAVYFLQIAALGVVGTVAGLVLGALAPLAIAPLIKGMVPAGVAVRAVPEAAGAGGGVRRPRPAGVFAVAAGGDRRGAARRPVPRTGRRRHRAGLRRSRRSAAPPRRCVSRRCWCRHHPIAASRCGTSPALWRPSCCSGWPGRWS